MGLNYSKWDNLSDSDDDKPPEDASTASKMAHLQRQAAAQLAEAPSKTKKKKKQGREQERRANLFDLAQDEEIQQRFALGTRSPPTRADRRERA